MQVIRHHDPGEGRRDADFARRFQFRDDALRGDRVGEEPSSTSGASGDRVVVADLRSTAFDETWAGHGPSCFVGGHLEIRQQPTFA